MPPNIGDILGLASDLESISDSPESDVQTILCYVLGKSRSHLYANLDSGLSDSQTAAFLDLLARRQNGEPVAYLTETKGFWNIELSVNPSVLIPRPETELLVELALSLPQDRIKSMLDLGTGSGAIAISLALERPHWSISATDITTGAIATARENAQNNQTEINFIKGHWCRPLSGMRFDLIVSNPPYVRSDDPHLDQPDLRYEPVEALASDVDGLAALREIILTARQHLNPGGWIVLEHGYDQSKKVCAMLDSNGYHAIEPHQAIAGMDRAVIARCDSTGKQ
jgi:release factor glutamine methyltransferase